MVVLGNATVRTQLVAEGCAELSGAVAWGRWEPAVQRKGPMPLKLVCGNPGSTLELLGVTVAKAGCVVSEFEVVGGGRGTWKEDAHHDKKVAERRGVSEVDGETAPVGVLGVHDPPSGTSWRSGASAAMTGISAEA